MYKELSDQELTDRLMAVDIRINGGITGAIEILRFVHTVFPLEHVMPSSFKGTHSLTLKENGHLEVGVWCNDKHYTVCVD
jgi:hypothetical protein